MARGHRCVAVLVTSGLLVVSALVFAQEPTPSEEAALQAYREGAFSRAVQLYTKALAEATDAGHRARLHVRIAWTLFALGREPEVDTHLKAALLEDPNLALIPDYYTQEFLDRFEKARREVITMRTSQQPIQPQPPGPAGEPQAPAPELEATLATIDERLAAHRNLEAALGDIERLQVAYPGDPRLPQRRLELLRQLGRTEAAAELERQLQADQLAGLPPGSTAFLDGLSVPDLILRANQLLNDGDAETSLELSRQAVGRQPNNVAALELMAEAARRVARWPEAELALKSALSLQPDSINLKLGLGEVFLAMGDTSAARDAFYEVAQRYPHSDRAWASLGLIEAHLGNRERALSELEAALKENPLLAEVQLAYGELLLLEGRGTDALEALRAASNLLHEDPQVQARLGQALLAHGNADEALEHLRAATEAGFAPPDVQRAMAVALMQKEMYAEAGRLLAELPEDSGGEKKTLVGLLKLCQGATAEVDADLREVAAARPNDPAVLTLLMTAVYRQGHFAEAFELASRAAELDPSNQTLAANLARARAARDAENLAQQARQVPEALPKK